MFSPIPTVGCGYVSMGKSTLPLSALVGRFLSTHSHGQRYALLPARLSTCLNLNLNSSTACVQKQQSRSVHIYKCTHTPSVTCRCHSVDNASRSVHSVFSVVPPSPWLPCTTSNEVFVSQQRNLHTGSLSADVLSKNVLKQCRGWVQRGMCTSVPPPPPKKLSLTDRLKQLTAQYGRVTLGVYIVYDIISFSCFYTAVKMGFEVSELLSKIGFDTTDATWANSTASNVVVAYAAHKIFAPIRIFLTVVSTPYVVKLGRSLGYIKVPPKVPMHEVQNRMKDEMAKQASKLRKEKK